MASRRRPTHHKRHHHHRRGSHRYASCKADCEFPAFPSKKWYMPFWVAIIILSVLFLLTAIGGIIANLVLTINFINTDNAGFEPQTPNFELFKNSRYEECSSLVPDSGTCATILDIINHTSYPLDQYYLHRGYIPISTDFRGKDGNYFDWCTTASCFNGYEVVPSSARSTVIGLTNFEIWTQVNLVTIVFLSKFLKRCWDLYKSDDHDCEGDLADFGIIEGVILIYNLGGNIIWWWVNYAEFANNPVPNSTVSIYAWSTTWLLASNIHYHPYSCVLNNRWRGLKRMLSWLLALLAVAQWSATVYILAVGRRDALQNASIYQGYDCTAGASGTTQCSAQRLCSDAALLSSMHFSWDFLEDMISQGSVALFVILSLVALQPFLFATWRSIKEGESWSEQFKKTDIGPIAGPAFAGFFGAFFTGIAATVGVYLSNHTNREAPLVADPYCKAVHVGLSTWRYYLDLDLNNRALQIAKSFFNA